MNQAASQRQENDLTPITPKDLDGWATSSTGPVALHLNQELTPVEADDKGSRVIYPPTYADIGYNVDTLSDGTKVALVDSVGSQANRMEPVFKNKFQGANGDPQHIVPQYEIVFRRGKEGDKSVETRSILDIAHRGADAVVMSTPGLAGPITEAFEDMRRTGDCRLLCALAPTSLVFGVWDSRGGSGEKRPRLVRAIVRAWDVEQIYGAAQFNSVWKALDKAQQDELESEAKRQKKKLSEKGFADAPATFRKVSTKAAKHLPEFRDGAANPDRRVLGGVLARGRIERDVTLNLVALRGLVGNSDQATKAIRRYLLGLSLLAATADVDLFLREGCHLRYTSEDVWHKVPRRGERGPVSLDPKVIERYAVEAYKDFKKQCGDIEKKIPSKLEHDFDIKEAKKLLGKADEAEAAAD